MAVMKIKQGDQWINIPSIMGAPGPQGIQGETGNSGVHVGSTEPTDPDVNVWVNPDGEGATLLKGDRGDTVIIAKDYADLTFPVYAGKTYCYHNNKPYVAKIDIATTEAWTAAHWDEVSFEDEIGDLRSAVQSRAEYDDYAEKLLGMIIPYNLFDINHVEDGYTNGFIDNTVIDATTGLPRPTTSNVATSYLIPVYGKKKIVLKLGKNQNVYNILRAACYGKDGSVLGISDSSQSEHILPIGTYYCRFSYTYGTGTLPTSYVTLCDDNIAGTNYQNWFEPYTKTEQLQKSIPLFVQRGKIKLPSDYRLGVLYSDGSIKASNSRVTYYEYMKFPQKMFIYKEQGYRATLCTYNDSHELISRISDTTFATNLFEIPENTYFRFTVYVSDDSPITDIDSVASGAYFWNPNNDLFDDSDTIALFESFAVIGDSLSCGFSGNGTNQYGSNVAREAHRNWPAYLSLKIGRPFTNLARGSSTAHDWRYGNTNLDVDIATADIDTYCYMVAVGVNDARNNNTIGTSADIKTDKSNNADSFYGNYDYVIRQLIEYKNNRFSQAKIFVFTMPPTETNAESYNTAIRYIAKLYGGCILIDLYKLYYNQFLTPPFSTVWIAGHSRPIGYMMLANMIRTAINKYMTENAQLFPWTPWLAL